MRKKHTSDDRITVKERLLYAGLRTFAQKGYAGVTIRSLCNECDSNLAAIKYYFGDKLGFYRAVHNFARDLMRNQAITQLDGYSGDDPWDLMREHINLLLSHSYDNIMFQASWLYIRERIDTTAADLIPPDEQDEQHRALFHERLRGLFALLLGPAAATDKNINLLEHTYFSLTLFLIIHTHISSQSPATARQLFIKDNVGIDELAEYILDSLKNSVHMMQQKTEKKK